jgi:hypothetical protein
MRITRKYYLKLLTLTVVGLCLLTQANAQFDDEGGPGGFDPPPPNDVPLDSYQWVMMGLAVFYGLYIFSKHHKRGKHLSKKNNTILNCAISKKPLNN